MREDPRVARNTLSVAALRDYLREIIQEPAKFITDTELRQVLNSQGALAKLSIDSRGIRASSKNTLERIADNSLAGGFAALERLRRGAIDAIDSYKANAQKSNKITKHGLLKRVKELETANLQLRQTLLLHTMVLDKSLAQACIYATESGKPHVLARCEREQRELKDMLSMRENPARSDIMIMDTP